MCVLQFIMKNKKYDLVVIGGGATGAGIALDASLRGLSVLLLEQNDFSEGTSSRSTKLVHGGVRYLESAFKRLDKEQFKLVKEGLRERKLFLENASHLAQPLELITPLYRWWEIPYIYFGLFLYDLISGSASLGRSRLLSAKKAMRSNPAINPYGLKGAVSYYDGAFNDSRMVTALLQSAEESGATVKNHCKVISIEKIEGKISGVSYLDKIIENRVTVDSKHIINATGPFCDLIRYMDDPKAEPILQTSSGIHIVVDRKFLPSKQGLMIPKTNDGRVLFALPYMEKCLVGTSDNAAEPCEYPEVTEKEIEYLLKNANSYFGIQITKNDILSSFSGYRPLIKASTDGTAKLSREYMEEFSESGLLTVAGGKWTSYRSMAESAVDTLMRTENRRMPSRTKKHKLVGSSLDKDSTISSLLDSGIDVEYARYLYDLYGDRSHKVLKVTNESMSHAKLHDTLHTTQGELIYTIRYEYVKKPLDFITRRVCIGLTDTEVALEILPAVLDIMQIELKWSDKQKLDHGIEARNILTRTLKIC